LRKGSEIYLFYADQTNAAMSYFSNLHIRLKILEREFTAHQDGNRNKFNHFIIPYVLHADYDKNHLHVLKTHLDQTRIVLEFLARDEVEKLTLFRCIGEGLKLYEEERYSLVAKQSKAIDEIQDLFDILHFSCIRLTKYLE
jgi:hypothetical protein